MLPGVARRHPVSSAVCPGVRGCSGDQQTFSPEIFLAFNSLRLTLQRGHTEVREISDIRRSSG